jgi:hypothetical protein
MKSLDADANRRFEFSKALLARATLTATDDERRSFSEAAITQAFSCLEGMISHIFEHFAGDKTFGIFEQAMMSEAAIKVVHGQPILGRQQFRSIEERLQFLFWRFSHVEFDTAKPWWASFSEAVTVRNGIMHPKTESAVDVADAERALQAIIAAIDDLMQTVFNKPWPKAKKGLTPSLQI